MCVEDFGEVRLALLDQLLELDDLANLFVCVNLVSLVSIDSQACRVIATIF